MYVWKVTVTYRLRTKLVDDSILDPSASVKLDRETIKDGSNTYLRLGISALRSLGEAKKIFFMEGFVCHFVLSNSDSNQG
jgi:hypothetical protein